MDRKANAAFYGSAQVTPEQIFSSSGNTAPEVANQFVQVLDGANPQIAGATEYEW